jgi:hypothetical protein
MKHSFLILFLFSSFHFILNAQQELALTAVSVDTVYPQHIKLTWLFEDIDSVTIYKCINQCNDENFYDRIANVKMDSTHLEWIDLDANAATLIYYSIGWSYSGKCPPCNNMVLDAKVSADSCLNSVSLSWNPYINMIDSLDCYKIYYRTNTDSAFIFLDSVKGEHLTGYYFAPTSKLYYPIKYLGNNLIYEFVIQAINKTKTEFSFSNIVNFETGYEDINSISLDITCVSVIDDHHIQVDVSTDTFINPFHKLFLYRDESVKPIDSEESLQFQMLDSLEYSLDYNPTNQYRFIDEHVNSNSRLYYYKAIADNPCKANDSSNIKTNILLYGDRAEKFLYSIQFAQIGFPVMDLNSHELYRIVNNIDFFIQGGLLRNISYFIDIKPFIDDGDVVKYQVKSEQGCFSNILIVAHEPIVEFPEIFYPQSKNDENKTFYPILRFPSEDHYLFIIYNRWGQELYRSTLPPVFGEYLNMQGRWDGTFQGKECPPDMYSFKISYNYNKGDRKYSNSGTFMLLR